jgi:high-affinity nickel permease
MTEIQIYSVIMFFAGVGLSKAVFYLDQKKKQRDFFLVISATVLQILDSVHSVHLAAIDTATHELKKLETKDETDIEKYLEQENSKVSIFMELYTLVLIKAVPEAGRKYINYSNWPEASLLIEQLRGIMQNEKDKS